MATISTVAQPKDWELETIGNLAQIKTGSKNTQDKVENGLYPFFVRSQTIERINSYSFDGEAVLTAGDGVGTGKVFHYINGKFDVHQRVYKISDFSPKLDGYYFYLVFSTRFYERIMQMTAKSSVDSVRMDMIANMEIPLPSIHEQKNIGKTIRDIDELIYNYQKLIAKKRDIKQATMQQLLTGKTRLPGFSGKWEQSSIGEIVESFIDFRGRTPKKLGMEWGGGEIPALSALNVKMGYIDLEADIYLGSTSLYQKWMTNGDVKKDDVVVTLEAPLGNIALIPDHRKYILSQRVVLMKTNKNKISNHWLLQFMMSTDFQKLLRDSATGSTASGIQRARFEKLPLVLPLLKEQEAIAAVLKAQDDEIQQLKCKYQKLQLLKQGMMQELLTGRIRLI